MSIDRDEKPEELGSAAKGKQGELVVIGKLLERGYKVYLPMVDTGIDCLVGVGGGNYKEIQVKYREGDPTFSPRGTPAVTAASLISGTVGKGH